MAKSKSPYSLGTHFRPRAKHTRNRRSIALTGVARIQLFETTKQPLRGVLLFGRPEDLGNTVNFGEQTITNGDVIGLLCLTGSFGGLPEQVVQVGVRSQVLGLKVVSPKNPKVVLHEVGSLFFDERCTYFEIGVARRGVLFHARFDGLRFEFGLRRVVDTARQVTVGKDGERCGVPVKERSNACFETHGKAFLRTNHEPS